MKIRALSLYSAFLASLLGSQIAWAVDAGDQLNQIERSQNKKERLRSPPKIEEDKEPPKLKTQAATFKVSNFLFEGNKLISSSELQVFLKEYLNREITLDELKLAVDSLSLLYKDKGYLASSSLPKQDITEGNVKIIIIEAKFGGTQLKLDPNTKARLVVENDDKASQYSVKDLYELLYKEIQIPITFDSHHHKFCSGNLTHEEAAKLAASTWGNVPAGFHFSSTINHESPTQMARAHADWIYEEITDWGTGAWIMVEAKAKEKAILSYMNEGIKASEFEEKFELICES
jgi:hypothetical protein